jgi:hypothetical protein
MREKMKTALQPVVGESAWAIGRAGWIVWIQFGAREMVTERRGTRVVGAYALHISGPRTWCRDDAVIANQDSALEDITLILAQPLVCNSVSATDSGALCLTFDDGAELRVYVDFEEEECWRLFRRTRSESHLVVDADGTGHH